MDAALILKHLADQLQDNVGNRLTSACANGIIQSVGRHMEEQLAHEELMKAQQVKPKKKTQPKE